MRRLRQSIVLQDIFSSLRARRSRTLLSLAALSIGMICLSMLAAVLPGLDRHAESLARELGAQVLVAHAPANEWFKPQAVEQVQKALPKSRVAPLTRHTIASANLNRSLAVAATGHELQRIKQWPMQSGRFLDPTDARQRKNHAVISQHLAERHHLSLGSLVLLEDIPFRVIGILGTSSDAPNQVNGLADLFIAQGVPTPWTEAPIHPGVQSLFVQWDAQHSASSAQQHMTAALLSDPSIKSDQLTWVTPDILLMNIRRLQLTLNLTVGTVALLCLALGGCTLMALMIATVRERVAEIGLRFSLGASRRSIYQLFIGEALIITACAALLGTLLGQSFLWLLSQYIALPVGRAISTIVLPILAALLLGMAFSFWPAWQAARIQPADALRYE